MVERLEGGIDTKPGYLLSSLPFSWHEWLRTTLGEDWILLFDEIQDIDLESQAVTDNDLFLLRNLNSLDELNLSWHTNFRCGSDSFARVENTPTFRP